MKKPWLQAGAVAVVLAGVAAAAYGPNAVHGGFLSDAWSIRSLYVFSANTHGFGGVVDSFLTELNQAKRPLAAVYLVGLNAAFGPHTGFWFAWLGATGAALSLSLYLLLRKLGLAFPDAGLIAILVLIFPATNSLHFWLATVHIPAALSLAALGFLLALMAFDALKTPRRIALHCASLAAFVMSVLLYEAALPLMLSSVALYRLHVPWRTAIPRWIADCVILIPLVLLVTLASSTGHEETEAGAWAHAQVIFESGRALFTTVVLPFGSIGWYIVALVALVPAAAILVYVRLSDTDISRADLRRWLVTLAAGGVVVAFGYAIYIPGTDYYNPIAPGVGDRVNALASVGWVLILYAIVMLGATLAFRGLPRARLLSSIGAAVACALISVGWIRSVNDYSHYFTGAYKEDVRVLTTIRESLPSPRPESTIWTFGQPVEFAPGVPVFGNTWDMTGSVQLQYDDPTLTSLVAQEGTVFYCRQGEVLPGGSAYSVEGGPDAGFASPYGRTYFLDTSTGRTERIDGRRQCRQAERSFQRSPIILGG